VGREPICLSVAGVSLKFAVTMSDHLWSEKITRDLKSIVCEPLLLDFPESSQLQLMMREAVLRFLAIHPDRLMQMIDRPNVKLPLGKWFERVFLLALRITFPWAEVDHSVPDGYGGELDFLVRDGRTVWHIECAVKFFLERHNPDSSLDAFVGPAGNDRLDLKFYKMRDIQLRRPIPSVSSADQVVRVLWMSGCIFRPLAASGENTISLPAPINPHTQCGCYASYEELKGTYADDVVLVILPRQWWMTSLSGLAIETLKVFPRFDPNDQGNGPIMVAALSGVDDVDEVDHCRRFFLI
jgi:hypothetical protein